MVKSNEALVKLYNRLSYYFCMTDGKDIEVKSTTTVKELQEMLDKKYEESKEGETNGSITIKKTKKVI